LQQHLPILAESTYFRRILYWKRLSFDSRAIGKQAGRMANRMLKGKKLSELVSPDLLSLVMNSQTADRLGLHIPSVLLKKAVLIYPERDGMQQ